MQRVILLLATLVFATSAGFAQVIGGNQDKLFDLFLLEKYDACYFKALKLTENESTKSDPEGYLYVSMCALKFNEDEELKAEYGDPLKDALKYASKAVKYHQKCLKKDIPTFEMEDNAEFFEELYRVGLEECIYYYNEDKFSKAASYGKKVAKVDPSIAEIQLFVGANMLLSKNLEGQKLVDEYFPKIKEKYKSGDVVPEESIKPALVYGVIALSKFYNDSGDSYKAKEVIQYGKDLFVDNMKIDRAYEALNP